MYKLFGGYMIKDKLINANTYYGLSKRIEQGLKWLKEQDLLNIECKKHYIESDSLYVNVQEYAPKQDADYEAHRRYADIQYMIKGSEKIGITNLNNCSATIPYDKNADIEFLKNNGKDLYIDLNEGEFMIFYPQDAHKPSIKNDYNGTVKKAVVKVLIDQAAKIFTEL